MSDVLHLFVASGFWNVPVAVVAAVVVTLAAERARVLVRLDGDARTFMSQLQKVVMSGDVEGAMRLCHAEPHSALSRVARSGLLRVHKGEAEVARAVEEARLEVLVQLRRREGVLLGLGLLSVCVGFMGTVFGMALTLRAAPGADERSSLPLGTMADDLGCAALGLAVAAVALCAHMYLASLRGKISAELDLYAAKLVHILQASRDLPLGPSLHPPSP